MFVQRTTKVRRCLCIDTIRRNWTCVWPIVSKYDTNCWERREAIRVAKEAGIRNASSIGCYYTFLLLAIQSGGNGKPNAIAKLTRQAFFQYKTGKKWKFQSP